MSHPLPLDDERFTVKEMEENKIKLAVWNKIKHLLISIATLHLKMKKRVIQQEREFNKYTNPSLPEYKEWQDHYDRNETALEQIENEYMTMRQEFMSLGAYYHYSLQYLETFRANLLTYFNKLSLEALKL